MTPPPSMLRFAAPTLLHTGFVTELLKCLAVIFTWVLSLQKFPVKISDETHIR
jgi:hypothetical protein